ncbi:conserved hypothetical protein [Candida dubliniensis CD36]|uniref:Plasma membrane fusion protein PRM1 n=1 Tax=Candida dubliniensis (strain CD36 / ATCC MYA-646 / CBS 7987 / NCPF 3949 / NRRL Y-17841) TaxID=573826 RepID=B9W9D6_CANDC|nr:conserved hypothetical protein [Candida dubliniensis CD36]CAX45418.1 conserved hypothetical protein [Candida dubliniensis CD36]
MFRNYLNLPEILTQVYLNKYAILLILILIKLILLETSILDNLDSVLLDNSICDNGEIQPVLNTIHYMIVDSLQTLEAAGIVSIILTLKVIKQLALFFIELFFGTYICLINAALKGSTEAALDASEGVIRAVNATVVSATNDIESALKGLSSIINDLVTGFSAIKNIFTGSKPDPTQYQNKINITLGNLKNKIMIPNEVLTKLDNFKNSSLYGLSQLGNGTQTIVSTPFELAIKKLNTMKSNYNFSTGAPSPINFRDECLKDMSKLKDVQTALAKLVERISKWLFIGLVLAMVGSILYVSYIQWRHWRRMDKFINETGIDKVVQFRNQYNIYNNFLIYTIVKRMGIDLNEKAIWMASYTFSEISRNVFFFGMMGVVSVAAQYILLNSVQSSMSNHIKSFDTISNSTYMSAPTIYLRDMNTYIDDTQNKLNQELFSGIKEVSVTLNSTIVEFLDKLNETLSDIFGNTPLGGPINTVVYCTIGRKLEKIEKGLTWMNDNLNINIPSISREIEDGLSHITFLQPQSILTKANKIIDLYCKSILLELYISLGLLGVWLFQIFVGGVTLAIRHWNSKRQENTSYAISSPRELSEHEKEVYGYPLSHPLINNSQDINTSSSFYPTTAEKSK